MSNLVYLREHNDMLVARLEEADRALSNSLENLSLISVALEQAEASSTTSETDKVSLLTRLKNVLSDLTESKTKKQSLELQIADLHEKNSDLSYEVDLLSTENDKLRRQNDVNGLDIADLDRKNRALADQLEVQVDSAKYWMSRYDKEVLEKEEQISILLRDRENMAKNYERLAKAYETLCKDLEEAGCDPYDDDYYF